MSAPTLLRLIRAMDLPEVPVLTVLGVDEFAFRRGRRFGAILVDVDSHRPVDVLPDHTADTFADWLREHPHIGMVCKRGSSRSPRSRASGPSSGTQRTWAPVYSARSSRRSPKEKRWPIGNSRGGSDSTTGKVEMLYEMDSRVAAWWGDIAK